MGVWSTNMRAHTYTISPSAEIAVCTGLVGDRTTNTMQNVRPFTLAGFPVSQLCDSVYGEWKIERENLDNAEFKFGGAKRTRQQNYCSRPGTCTYMVKRKRGGN